MPTFKVKVTKWSPSYLILNVTAKTEEEAKDLAEFEADETDENEWDHSEAHFGEMESEILPMVPTGRRGHSVRRGG